MLKIAYHPLYAHPLPEGHRFPMLKYELIPEQLLYEGTIQPDQLFAPEACSEEAILRVHTADYWQRMQALKLTPKEIRKIGFPLSAALVQREITIAQGTLDAAQFALQHGVAMNVAGGTHHAYADSGEGFCLLNDQAIAAAHLLAKGLAQRVLVVDLDVHQGNGTAKIFENEPRVFTFSMHGASNYPHHKEQSNLDLPLPNGTDDATYLALLEEQLTHILAEFQPDFMFYQAGVDVLGTDKLGKLGLSITGCAARDAFVLRQAHRLHLPLVICMGGGYSTDIRHILEAHCNTYRLAQQIFFE